MLFARLKRTYSAKIPQWLVKFHWQPLASSHIKPYDYTIHSSFLQYDFHRQYIEISNIFSGFFMHLKQIRVNLPKIIPFRFGHFVLSNRFFSKKPKKRDRKTLPFIIYKANTKIPLLSLRDHRVFFCGSSSTPTRTDIKKIVTVLRIVYTVIHCFCGRPMVAPTVKKMHVIKAK